MTVARVPRVYAAAGCACVRVHRWMAALRLCLDFHEARSSAAIGLPRNVAAMQKLTGDKIAELLAVRIGTMRCVCVRVLHSFADASFAV